MSQPGPFCWISSQPNDEQVPTALGSPTLVTKQVYPGGSAAARAQPAWFIDPSNASLLASDSNSGADALHPIVTSAEVIRRWGGYVPTLTVPNVAITYLSGSPDTSDPAIWMPYCNGTTFTVTAATPPTIATGNLSGVVANSIPTNQALNANLPAGTVAGALVVNTTRSNSFARAFKNLGGNLWQISQPIAANPPPNGPPVQDNTWANGDAVNVFAPATNAAGSGTVFNVNIAVFAPVVTQLNATFNNVPTLQNINLGDPFPTEGGFAVCQIGGGCGYVNVSFSKHIWLNNFFQAAWNTRFNGCDIAVVLQGGQTVQNTILSAGCWRNTAGGWLQGVVFDCGHMIQGNSAVGDNIAIAQLGTVYVDTGSLHVRNAFSYTRMVTTFNGNQPAVYGSGGLNAEGTLVYTGTAVASFPCAGGITIGGKPTAYSALTTAGTTAWHQVPLTPANIDAAAGAAGFGGYAVWPNAGCITNLAAQP